MFLDLLAHRLPPRPKHLVRGFTAPTAAEVGGAFDVRKEDGNGSLRQLLCQGDPASRWPAPACGKPDYSPLACNSQRKEESLDRAEGSIELGSHLLERAVGSPGTWTPSLALS